MLRSPSRRRPRSGFPRHHLAPRCRVGDGRHDRGDVHAAGSERERDDAAAAVARDDEHAHVRRAARAPTGRGIANADLPRRGRAGARGHRRDRLESDAIRPPGVRGPRAARRCRDHGAERCGDPAEPSGRSSLASACGGERVGVQRSSSARGPARRAPATRAAAARRRARSERERGSRQAGVLRKDRDRMRLRGFVATLASLLWCASAHAQSDRELATLSGPHRPGERSQRSRQARRCAGAREARRGDQDDDVAAPVPRARGAGARPPGRRLRQRSPVRGRGGGRRAAQ